MSTLSSPTALQLDNYYCQLGQETNSLIPDFGDDSDACTALLISRWHIESPSDNLKAFKTPNLSEIDKVLILDRLGMTFSLKLSGEITSHFCCADIFSIVHCSMLYLVCSV